MTWLFKLILRFVVKRELAQLIEDIIEWVKGASDSKKAISKLGEHFDAFKEVVKLD